MEGNQRPEKQEKKINKTKSYFFTKINKIDKALVRLRNNGNSNQK